MRAATITLAALIASINALKITSPTAGQTLDPTQPITVTWTSDSSDPSSVDILSSDPNGFISETRIARDVSTSSGSYIIPAGSIQSYGTGFVIKVDSSDGKHLATSGTFDLSMGVGAQVNGQSGLAPLSTFTGTSAVTQAASSASNAAATITGSGSSRSGAIASSATGSEGSATESGSESTTLTGSRTGFSTSTMSGTSRSSTSTRSASSTSASSAATTSANAQPRLASASQIVLSGAGLIAGLAALLA